MDFSERLKLVKDKINSQAENVLTEEATKTAFVLPFINALGYDIFNPLEVIPEFTADIGLKKGEKVDYAIMKDNKDIILIEVKCSIHDLNEYQATQLRRYFGTTDSRVAILTNGIYYKFYSDLDKENVMDDRPFYEIDIRKIDEYAIKEIKRFSKTGYDPDEVLKKANDLKYLYAIKTEIVKDINDPSEEYVRIITGRVYSGRKTSAITDRFKELIKAAYDEYIRKRVQERLQSALENESVEIDDEYNEDDNKINDGIVTTEEEKEGYYIVKAIASEVVEPKRVVDRDRKTYFGILLDDNNRKPICRLHFNTSQKYIGIFDSEKNETRYPIEEVFDIYKYKTHIQNTVKSYE